ncbi:MAG: T9SS type A sorting domain-containing protein [Hymenobacteraceae bacterium]|nr:T9SS type A sorting domain-containing protein [Hymenobacteraceae bacterium]MDX5394713.1 T9SS type A sorting domain-containing protein [Hymenobacteraceae bacterium]MDX5442875.1 T9SS type A sorting domain-containing protein [Hymenobacteraceae bacterium]MDX5510746.1 T9SS type A sorting domain-containing protein [Hymenobacteraceae bacterium]
MKKLYTLLGVAAMLLGATATQAQDYMPLRPNHTHHFSDAAQDSIFSLKIDSVYTVGADSVFMLNKMGRHVNFESSQACSVNGILYWMEDNLLGQRMVKQSNGDYLFISSASDTFTIKTRVPVGQSWNFRNNGSVTASVTAKAVEAVSGRTDSVITYSLSNGKTIKLSKNYGFVKIHALRAYYQPNTAHSEWQFFALPEKGVGKATLNALTIYDYQVGDSLGWHRQNFSSSGVLCNESWLRKHILNKTTNATQDTVWYEVERQSLAKYYGSSGQNPPPGMGCMGPNRTDPLITDTVTEMYTRNSKTRENLTTRQMIEHLPRLFSINTSIYKSNINSRYVAKLEGEMLVYDSCAKALRVLPDGFVERKFMEGVGMYEVNSANIYDYTRDHLEFYRKGTESYGNYISLRTIASTKEPIFASPMVAYPNPVAEELTLQLDNLKPGNAIVMVYNQLGQVVLEKQLKTEQGKQQLYLNMQQLSPGIYLLQVQKNGATESIKVLKQ